MFFCTRERTGTGATHGAASGYRFWQGGVWLLAIFLSCVAPLYAQSEESQDRPAASPPAGTTEEMPVTGNEAAPVMGLPSRPSPVPDGIQVEAGPPIRPKSPLTFIERVQIYGRQIPHLPTEIQERAREFPEEVRKIPERLRNFPEDIKKFPDEFSDEMDKFVREIPFPGAPPKAERPEGWSRRFFLELPKEDIDEAEGFGLVPQLGYTQETDFIYGLGFAVGSLVSPRDNFQLTLTGTSKNQYEGTIEYIAPKLWEDRFRIETLTSARRWLTSYFGEGTDTKERDEDQFDYDAYQVHAAFWVKFLKYLRVGFVLNIDEWYIDELTYDRLLVAPFTSFGPFSNCLTLVIPAGCIGGRDLMLGGGFAFDSRDNEFFPNKGVLLEGRFRRSDGAFGSDFDYSRITADFRAFWTPKKSGHVFALRVYYDATWGGSPPFFNEPFLGGETFNRGYFEGRFRDTNALVVSFEHRFPIYGRINAALFGEVGQVAHSPLDFQANEFKPSGGAAIGYLIPPGKVLLVRLEVAASEDGVTAFLRFGNPF